MAEIMDRSSQYTREVLVEQIIWLISCRWFAVGAIVAASLVATYVFPVLASAIPVYVCAGLLLLSNIIYFWVSQTGTRTSRKYVVLGTIQAEVDLLLLTAILHFSGGAINPFFLFYIFHVIIATVILPRNLSFAVGLTAIFLFGLLAVNELNGGMWLGYYPLQFSVASGIWRNPVYVLGIFVSFVCTIVLAQYLTRMVVVRMTTKELEAARNKDMLEAVISAMAEGLIFVTCDGSVEICNPAVKLWKESNRVENGTCSLVDLPAALAEHIRGLVSGGDKTTTVGQLIKFHTTGPLHRYVEARSCPVIGVDGQKLGYVIVGQDLTKHKKTEKELIEQTEEVAEINEMLKMSRIEMAQREKMVAIGQMAAGIAHEIGNPLASLSSVAQYLNRKLRTHEEKEHLLSIVNQVSRISNILKRMLSLSRPATSEYRWIDINELIDNTLSLVKFDRRVKSVTIKNVAGANLPMVWLNPQHFEQVLLNIFINALDAMNAKQEVLQHVLKITRESKDGMIEVRINDTGIGMSPEICKRAFESFFTTKEIGKGTGLGLFISYNLVTEIDGTITLDSELGKGTTIIIRIPVRPKKDLVSGNNGKRGSLDNIGVVKRSEG